MLRSDTMNRFLTTIFQTGKQHTNLLCTATGIFALVFALPLLEFIFKMPFAIWQQQNYPTGMMEPLTELWLPFSNVLSAAAFALLGIMLLKSPKHLMVPIAVAAIAIAELINGIVNLNYGILQLQGTSFQIGLEITAIDYFIPTWYLIQAIITILYAIVWLLPIAARFTKKESNAFILIPALLFLVRVVIGIFTGSMTENYYISQFIQTATIISLCILLLNDHQKPAFKILKK